MSQVGSGFERMGDGGFRPHLSKEEREILRSLPGELRALLGTEDPALRRLTPPAHPDDPAQEAEYRNLVGGELERQRLNAVETMERTIDAEHLDEEQLAAWLTTLNYLRLVLGTRLDVTEEMYDEAPPEGPRGRAFALYLYLGWLEEQIVTALAESLPSN